MRRIRQAPHSRCRRARTVVGFDKGDIMSDPKDPKEHTDGTAAQAGSESPEEGAEAEEAAEDAVVDGEHLDP
ncbi:hypothetical protein GCM10009803_00740 [Microbacterium ginsengiterrae]